MPKKTAPPPEPNIVREFRDEDGRVIGCVADDSIETDAEKTAEILHRTARLIRLTEQ